MSVHSGIVSEYTSMALFVTETLKKEAEVAIKQVLLEKVYGYHDNTIWLSFVFLNKINFYILV